MNKLLLGGILGAAALTAAAYIFDEETDEERKYDFLKKDAEDNPEELKNNLTKLEWDITHLTLDLSNLYLDFSSVLGDSNLKLGDMPDSGFIDKLEDYIHEGSSIFIRGNFISKVNELRNKIIAVFTSYKEVIIKANQLLKSKSEEKVSFKGITLRNSEFKTDNSLDNENWDDQVMEEMDKLENFLNEARDRVSKLIEALEKNEI